MDNIKLIIKLLNTDPNSPFKCIQAYGPGNPPAKPYATYFELETLLDDITGPDITEFTDENKDAVKDSADYYGEYPIQFDVFSDTIESCRIDSRTYWEFIIYKLREMFHRYGIGITTHTSPNPIYEYINGKYEYRRTFRITFEFDTTVEKIVELAKKLEVTANNEKFDVELKG